MSKVKDTIARSLTDEEQDFSTHKIVEPEIPIPVPEWKNEELLPNKKFSIELIIETDNIDAFIDIKDFEHYLVKKYSVDIIKVSSSNITEK